MNQVAEKLLENVLGKEIAMINNEINDKWLREGESEWVIDRITRP